MTIGQRGNISRTFKSRTAKSAALERSTLQQEPQIFRCPAIMEAGERMTAQRDPIYSTVNRNSSEENREFGRRREVTLKLPFTPLENLNNQRVEPLKMAQRGPALDPYSGDTTLTLGSKSSRSNNIKDKISLWEGKELTHLGTLGKGVPVKRTDSLPKTHQAPEKQGVVIKEREDSGKGYPDLRPCSPDEVLKHGGTVDNQTRDDCRRVPKEKHDHEKENVEHPRALRPSSSGTEQVGSLRKGGDRRTTQQANQEKRDVFTLFKKLEAMGDNHRKMPPELGNYFSPPGKDIKVEGRPKENENSGKEEEIEHQDNVYAEPGAPPINPIPKPRRTFQHPAAAPVGKNQADGRGQRNLPPLPSLSLKTSSKPPSGFYGRPRTVRDNINRRSMELEDLLGTNSPLFRRSLSQEHHYEDILDLSKENVYEDIELESQCSQQSVPSSPGADISKASRPAFFRQNSGRSFKLLDLKKAHQQVQRANSGGVASPLHLSPPSTPTGSDQGLWLAGDPYSRSCRRIPTVVLRINGIFEARSRKKHLRRIYHYSETSSGRATDENSDSESEFEERSKAHRQRLVSVQSILSQSRSAPLHYNGSHIRKSPLHHELHQRRLFEYFLVVSLQKSKDQYLPEVTQQFPPKLERSFKFLRETEDQLKIIPQFCFPDAKDWESVETYQSEMFSFVLTGEDGSRKFGYCRRLLPSGRGKRLPEVYCIVSHLGCFNLFSKVLDEVERRRALSPALVQPLMRAIMEAQFPAPGRTISIKTFLPGSGTEVMELCRPSDSRLEHVDFECLFSCLSLRLLLRVFGSLLLERRIIFTADNLSTLSQCCHAVVALLYPFVWQHTYIPVLPSAMLDIVCTPTPFIVGLLSSSLPHLTELPLEEVLVVDLGNSRFLRQLDDEDSILPAKLQSALENILERRRELANERGGNISGDSEHLSTVVSETFVRFFVELVGHYPLFITGEREDGYSSSSSSSPAPCSFQREGFLKAIPSKTVRRFLEVFMETQMFGWFIQERELHRQALRGLFEVRVQEYLDSIRENEHRRVNKFLKGLGICVI
uniref:UDENN domain-containing protein n=1 Tax=Oryzias melastigma TaxID=30732 RepID=A0A3B3C5N2_ORYME